MASVLGKAAVRAAPTKVKYTYFVPRNTKGSLPVYSDIRGGGTRYEVLVKHVQGDATELKEALHETLFHKTKQNKERSRMVIDVHKGSLVITGGRWKNDVTKWLMARGF